VCQYTYSRISFLLVMLARPGTPPKQAQEPKETMRADFCLSSLAICSFSLFLIAPLMRVAVMYPSGMASTSFTLASTAMGQNAMSAISATPRIFSSMSSRATSHPPHPAAQYCAILIFAIYLSSLLLVYGVRPQFPDGAVKLLYGLLELHPL